MGLWQIETEFVDQWANNAIEGWENMGQENGHVPAQHTVIDLHYYSTVEELVEVGPEKLIIGKEFFIFIFNKPIVVRLQNV